MGKSRATERAPHAMQLSLHLRNAQERNLQHAMAEEKASD